MTNRDIAMLVMAFVLGGSIFWNFSLEGKTAALQKNDMLIVKWLNEHIVSQPLKAEDWTTPKVTDEKKRK